MHELQKFGLVFGIVLSEHVCQKSSQQILLLGKLCAQTMLRDTNSSKTSALKAFCWRHMNSFTQLLNLGSFKVTDQLKKGSFRCSSGIVHSVLIFRWSLIKIMPAQV